MTATFAEAYNDILDRFQTTWNPTGFIVGPTHRPAYRSATVSDGGPIL